MPKHSPKYTLICSRCGSTFQSSRSDSIYCSECRQYPKRFETTFEDPKSRYFRRCPFCGKNPKLNRFKVLESIRYRYECSNSECIASSLPARDFVTEEEARRYWNGRV